MSATVNGPVPDATIGGLTCDTPLATMVGPIHTCSGRLAAAAAVGTACAWVPHTDETTTSAPASAIHLRVHCMWEVTAEVGDQVRLRRKDTTATPARIRSAGSAV